MRYDDPPGAAQPSEAQQPGAQQPGAPGEVAMPTWSRLHLTHAVMQAIADECGADILHLKGPSVAKELRTAPRRSTDVDVLVRPAHLKIFLAALEEHGWSLMTSFAEGSSFQHAANYSHPRWAHVDVHRWWPGPTKPPDMVFAVLWESRQTAEIAHHRCAVPSLAGQLLVLMLHEARSHRTGTVEAWELSDTSRRDDTWSLARLLGAEVPLAAALGALDEYAGRPDYPLWRYWSQPETGDAGADRLGEWLARMQSERSRVRKIGIALNMMRVNRTHLRMDLGHEPSTGEIAVAYRERAMEGWREIRRRVRIFVSGGPAGAMHRAGQHRPGDSKGAS